MENLSILDKTSLFCDLNRAEISEILSKVPTKTLVFDVGDIVVHQGEILKDMGVVLFGSAIAIKNGFDGEEVIISHLKSADIFGDILSGSINFESPVTVKALTRTQILFISYFPLLYSNHPAVHKVLQNMIKTISHKFFAQSERIELLMIKSVRIKITTFLEYEKEKHNSNSFKISFNRKQLADYLGVERTALSRELSRMQKDGIIQYNKSHFILL